MNRGVLLALFAATLTPLLNRVACQPQCDMNDCSDQCVSLGALRWSFEKEGCLCTFPLEGAKTLYKGGGGNGGGSDSGSDSGSGGGSGGDSCGDSGGDSGGDYGDDGGGGGGVSNRDKQKDKHRDDDYDYDNGGGGKKSKGTTKSPEDSGKKRKPPGQGAKPPGGDGPDTIEEGGSGDKAGQPPRGTQSSKGTKKPTTSAENHGQKDYGQKDYGQKDYGQKDYGVKSRGAGDELMPRKALEPDGGAGSRRKGGKMHMPFIVRSLHKPLSPNQVMEQLNRQKGDIPMKEIQDFLKKGGR